MAQATDLPITSRFHNLSSGALADALGHADAVPKGAEAECKALSDHIRRKPSPGRQMRPRRLQRVAGAFPRG
jgi:hypothetical protein